MSTEKMAVNKVREVISKVHNIDEFINAGDREPSWDGFIYVYKNSL